MLYFVWHSKNILSLVRSSSGPMFSLVSTFYTHTEHVYESPILCFIQAVTTTSDTSDLVVL